VRLTPVAAALLLPIFGAAAQETHAVGREIDSLLNSGQYRTAHSIAQRLSRTDEADPHSWILLSRTLTALDGSNNRLQAVFAAQRAVRLSRNSIAALRALVQAGIAFGGGDGERIARDALQSILAVHPSDTSAWDAWLLVYRSAELRRGMRRILSRHDSVPVVRFRIARLYIEDESYDSATAILDDLLLLDSTNSDWLALRAQAAYESDATIDGWRFYRRALRHSDRAASVIWSQAIGIATPAELLAWRRTQSTDRPAFLEQFWGRRNPNLFTGNNSRVAEHFQRLRLARRRFPLLHPLSAYQRNRTGRDAEAAASIAEQLFYQRCEAREGSQHALSVTDRTGSMASDFFGGYSWNPLLQPGDRAQVQLPPGQLYLDPETVRLLSIPHARDIRSVDTVAARVGYNLATGLDDRGLMLLRWGEPEREKVGSDNAEDGYCRITDLERWSYAGLGTVRFLRPNRLYAGLGAGVRTTGDVVFRPMTESQYHGMVGGLTRDTTSVAATLEFGFWVAQFAADRPGFAELIVAANVDTVAAVLIGPTPTPNPVVAFDGVARILAAGGSYEVLVHGRSADSLGRHSGRVRLRTFRDVPSMSDIILGSSWPVPVLSRSEMIGHVSGGLSFREGATLRAYVELYGVPEDNRRRYMASYTIAPLRDPEDLQRDSLLDARVLSFERDHPGGDQAIAEWLDISTAGLDPGPYVVRVEARDFREGRRIGRAQIVFRIR